MVAEPLAAGADPGPPEVGQAGHVCDISVLSKQFLAVLSHRVSSQICPIFATKAL